MTHAAAFLADILEHPADDAPRLIFADWLDEYGGRDDRDRRLKLEKLNAKGHRCRHKRHGRSS